MLNPPNIYVCIHMWHINAGAPTQWLSPWCTTCLNSFGLHLLIWRWRHGHLLCSYVLEEIKWDLVGQCFLSHCPGPQGEETVGTMMSDSQASAPHILIPQLFSAKLISWSFWCTPKAKATLRSSHTNTWNVITYPDGRFPPFLPSTNSQKPPPQQSSITEGATSFHLTL